MSQQYGWDRCVKCLTLFYNDSYGPGLEGTRPVNTGSCAAADPLPGSPDTRGHHTAEHAQETPYVLYEDLSGFGSPAPDYGWSQGFKHCVWCEALFTPETLGFGPGVCPGRDVAGQPHVPERRNYLLSTNMPQDVTNPESGWEMCGRCNILFYAADAGNQGVCPVDGDSHNGVSTDFQVPRWR